MAATKQDIRDWLKEARDEGCTHMLVVCDTFDYDDYPVFVKPTDDVRAVLQSYREKDMQSVMEVYNLSLSIEEQLSEHRAYHV